MAPVQYSCRKCRADFPSRETAITHYTEKWHQHNLMRLLKDLTPITKDTYEKVMTKSTFLEQAKNSVNTISCTACKKSFNTQGSFDTHQRSRKHKQNIQRRVAENIRRLRIQKIKEAERKTKEVAAADSMQCITETTDETEETEETGAEYCTACKAPFASEKDLRSHCATARHINALKLAKLTARRKKELDDQDKEFATKKDDDMEVEEVDSDEWDEDEANKDVVVEEEEVEEVDEAKPLDVTVCLFCGKRSGNLADNFGHMERQHSFFVPHKEAGDMARLQQHLGEKVGELHQCLECSKEFRTLRACRLHMLDKPHLALRFEGEYDQFFDISKILADIQLPFKPAENDIFAFPMPNGTMLTHRDLRRYFKQRLSLQPTAQSLKRLRGTGGLKALTHLGKVSSESKSIVAIRKENQRRTRDLNVMHKTIDKKRLKVGVKANKLQPHFRLQVINAG